MILFGGIKLKYKSAAFILLLILLMLTACTETEKIEKEQSIDDSEITYTFENQNYNIVHATPFVKEYIDRMNESSKSENLELYKEIVIEPIYKDCFENGEFLYMAEKFLNSPPNNLIELEKISETLENRKEIINGLIEHALLKSADLLPSQSDITVCVLPYNNENNSIITVGAGKILIPYNDYFKDDFIKVSIAHEYHHSVWAEKHLSNNNDVTVLDNLIFEGKAVMFEKTVYPYVDHTPIDFTYNKELWSKIEPDLYKKDLNRSFEIIMGGNDLPPFYGYSEGYKMIKSYLDLHPDQTPEEWTALSSQEIIEEGKYLENYK